MTEFELFCELSLSLGNGKTDARLERNDLK